MRTALVSALLAVPLVCLFPLEGRVFGGIEGDAELLKLVANGYKTNREKIVTWQGKARIARQGDLGEPGEFQERTQSAIFVYDAERKAKRWNIRQEMSKTTKDGVVLWESQPDSDFQQALNAMVKNEAIYRYHNQTPKSHSRRIWVTIDDISNADMHYMWEDFDPEYYMSYMGRDVHDKLIGFLRYKDDPRSDIRISRAGDIVRVETRFPSVRMTLDFDLSKGYNIVRREAVTEEDGKRQIWMNTWDYEEHDGVFIPVRHTHDQDKYVDGVLTEHSEKEVTFFDYMVNEPVDESEFTLAALGVTKGDKVWDKRTGATFVYGEAPETAVVAQSPELDDLADSILDDEEPAQVPTPAPSVVTPQDPPSAPIVIVEEPAADEAPTGVSKGLIAAVVAGLLALATVLVITRRKTSS